MRPLGARPICVVLGAGGHARVLIDSLQAQGNCGLYGVLDRDPMLKGTTVLDVPVIGDDSLLPAVAANGVDWFVVGRGSVGDNRPREQLFDVALSHGLRPLLVVHPSAVVSARAVIGDGCQILPGAIINAGAELGRHVIVNSGAIIEHDCRIGAHVHVATGARLAGDVRVGTRSHIGAGATVRNGVVIGADVIVGLGAAVVSDVIDEQVVVGVPARLFVRQGP